jgi:hypothetical protein
MSAPGAAGRTTGRVEPGSPLACGDGEFAAMTVKPSMEHPTTTRPPLSRVGRLRGRLGSRDLVVLQSLAKLRLLTGDQLRRLHVADGSPVTQARRARALLQRLADLRLVVRLGRRVGGVRAGSSGYVYGLSGHGQAVLAVDGPMGGRRRRVWETSPSFQDHVLDVAEVYVRLVEAERTDTAELLAFTAEPACWRTFPGIGGQTVILKPDGFVRLAVGDFEHSTFIEVDRGTESVPTLVRKMGVYVAYWRSGIEQAEHEVFPRVLWLANSNRSVLGITRALRQVPADAQHLFHATFLDGAIPVLTATARGGRMA